MEIFLRSIALNERSYSVSLLQEALAALGLPVARDEITRREAGSSTLEKVRILQAQLNVSVDDSVLVDETTASAFTLSLQQRGLMTASRSFAVSGAVRLLNGDIKKRQRLLAFDLDLRGVVAYRDIKSLAEIEKSDAFEFLGEADSNGLGSYRIEFYDWQYRRAERKKADVVVYAVDGEDVIGRSRMVNAEAYSESGLVRDLDVVILQRDEATEYDALMAALNAFLRENETSLADIATSRDQLVFTANELDVDLSRICIAAVAESLIKECEPLSHELLYGIGRQGIRLSWVALYKKQHDLLRKAIAMSVDQRIIGSFTDDQVTKFLQTLKKCAAQALLDDDKTDSPLNAMLSNALPERRQRIAFLNSLRDFNGDDFADFWNEHLPSLPEFKEKPELVSAVLLTQQLTLLTGDHQDLVRELQSGRNLVSMRELFDLAESDWLKLLKKTGVPDFIAGDSDEEKIKSYAAHLQSMLNSVFPTWRIAKMLDQDKLPIEKTRIAKSIATFLADNAQFDFADSRIHDFIQEIKSVAGEDFDDVRSELMKLQRVFQVSTTPEAMTALMAKKLFSAHSIASIPRKSFISAYGDALGGQQTAFAIHQRASHISTRADMNAMYLMEQSHAVSPSSVMGPNDHSEIVSAIENKLPNYSDLFGSPDICECEHCSSVYSAAAYFVELLRFLWRGATNANGKTPLDMLSLRRPDLLHLPLTCENTNTLIPYIDLANEVLEFYVANDSLGGFKGYSTGDTTSGELRANPQHFDLEAYRKLKDATYPFSLPYHQPLNVIRTYSNHLTVSRYEALKALNPQADAATIRAIEAESLYMCQEEYAILTAETFDGTAVSAPLHEYFGYATPGELNALSKVREFMERSGIAYTDLVELLKTQFINPYQSTLDFLQAIIAQASIDPATLYTKLEQIESSTLDPANDTDIVAALNAYNNATGSAITTAEFGQWVVDHFGEFRQVITLYEPESKCDLTETRIRTLQSIYEKLSTSGIENDVWSKLHRFIRLWRKLGWTIHETDLMISALGEDDITVETISKLASVASLRAATKRPFNQLAVLWGNIDTYGKKSLYKKLFLNRAVQQIDVAFKADAWGNYLQNANELLADHQSALLAAFRITEEDLNAIMATAEVIDGGNPRRLDLGSDTLNIENLSTVYRYVVLAKGLKMRAADLCKLIGLFDVSPFSLWDIQQQTSTSNSPQDTYAFYTLAASIKTAGFKPAVLEYILQGIVAPGSTLGLDKAKTLQTVQAIRDSFTAIEQEHPEVPQSPLTVEILTAKLSLTFQPDTVSRFIAVIDDSALFETVTDNNLNVTIPDDLADKYMYIKGSGRLTCAGIMTDAEQATLKSLTNVNNNFKAALDELYAAPENFIATHFNGVFNDLAGARTNLLDHPAQLAAARLDEKLSYVYRYFLPVLKSKLRKDAVTQHIAALIGLGEDATALLIAGDIDALIGDLAEKGFSAAYFNATNWNNLALERVDRRIDFNWGSATPDTLVTADNFSVRWRGYIAAAASDEYTFVVQVTEADEAFKLYLDGVLILEKPAMDTNTSWEVVTQLNAAQMHLLVLEYAETSQTAGVRLYWKTATTARQIVPGSATYPAAMVDVFFARAGALHRAVKFILGFEISETELDHLIAFASNFANIDFKALTAEHWLRVRDYMSLRNAVPQTQASLVDVFKLANTPNPIPSPAELTETLQQATAWDQTSLEYLSATHFNLSADDFKNEIMLNRLYQVMQIVRKAGISAKTVAAWGVADTNFDVLHTTAQSIKNTVKAKYDEEDWLDVAGSLSDTLRENQQRALVDHLLTRPAIQTAGIEDADGLFEFFLIDVQMTVCMETSRIVQANAAVQMFINRCLLNLESDKSNGTEQGVSPGSIDKQRWEWMKNYRVWEANRKVFLYPENWLEPEWRNDRSVFFKDLESYLVQNDITQRSVERGFRNYLADLNVVANLEVCGTFQENEQGKLKYLHVFARTHNLPYKFFYRRWNKYKKWSAWEPVPLDIRSVEDDGHSGVHLIPVVWKNRMFLFWPEFTEVPETTQPGNQSVEDTAKQNIANFKPKKYWRVKLAWSEYVDGKWRAKQLSKEINKVTPDAAKNVRISDFEFHSYILEHDELSIVFSQQYTDNGNYRRFRLTDSQSKVELDNVLQGDPMAYPTGYQSVFMKKSKQAPLVLKDNTYLQTSREHKLIYSHQFPDFESKLAYPFFYQAAHRTYFANPVNIKIRNAIKKPWMHKPYMPDIVDDSRFAIFFEIPDGGPYNYLPQKNMLGSFSGESAPIGALTSTALGMMGASAGSNGIGNALGSSMEGMLPYSKNDSASNTSVGAAFDATADLSHAVAAKLYKFDKGLEFHTFYHPFSSKYVARLNQGGMPALMGCDTEDPSPADAIKSDEGVTFEDAYDPNFTHGFVKRHSNFDTPPDPRTAYKENVCFDVYGANSLYNWELFFHAPLYIATRLSKNGKYEEAMKWFHYIFDPTTDAMPEPGQKEIARYWNVLPFKRTPTDNLENWFKSLAPNTDPNTENMIIGEWRDNPFDPHLIASNRPLAYMKHVVIKYVQNLIAWGDALFRRFTRESVYEALQLYVIANHILGPRPEFVPKRGEIKAETYFSLQNKWDDFSNALVELENIFPYSSNVSVNADAPGPNLLGIGPTLYFCIPPNDKLLESWDTVADRLFKIRHCQDIDGVERQLALFAPPIDPAALIQATSQGLSLGSILADLSSPPPIYRFAYLIQKANEFCSDVKALGSALLAVLEKKDAEALGRLRASHEIQMLELLTAIKERQVLDAMVYKQNLQKAAAIALFRFQHFKALLGDNSPAPPPPPALGNALTADSQLPADRNIATINTDVDESLVEGDERGIKLIPKEKEDIDKSDDSMTSQGVATGMQGIAGSMNFFPNFSFDTKPFGMGTGFSFGGSNIGAALTGLATVPQLVATVFAHEAAQAAKTAGFIRREQEWTLQANLAAKEIVQLDKQITSADIRIQIAKKELENHKQQIKNAEQVEFFLHAKFTNQELYQWMKEQLFAVYKQSYNLAYDMAKKAEKAYKYEKSTDTASFIQYGYWDNSKQGLVAGEKLQLALRQLEKSYLEENRRELELSKSVSLALLNPLALIELRETGKCYLSLPEELFDLDFRGHYFRRIRSVSVSIPCIAGPYTAVNCSLRLLKNTTRMNTSMNNDGNYEHENDEGLWIDDDRFRDVHVSVTSIATSSAQNDAGLFEFSFRDERYLPFEGAGAISEWMLELSTKTTFRQFDYATISDVILHVKYTARENGGLFKEKATAYIKDFLVNAAEVSNQPLMRMLSMRHEFPTEWHRFLYPGAEAAEQVLNFTTGLERLPFFTHDSGIVVMKIELFAKCVQPGSYHAMLSYVNFDEDTVSSTEITIPESNSYGGLKKATLNVIDAGMNLEELDIRKAMTLKIKHNTAPDYTVLTADEIEDIFVVFHFKLQNVN